MGIKSKLAKPVAKINQFQTDNWIKNPLETQDKWFKKLILTAKNTVFGKDHNFEDIQNYEDFKKAIPIRDYEALRPYIDRVVQGESDICWKGKPLYLAKTSGTTSGSKYIPISHESMPFHIKGSKNALMAYMRETGNTNFVDGKVMFLQGSPTLETKNGIDTGRLSGIAAHFVPSYLQQNRMPSWETNCMEDWEPKVEKVIDETIEQDMRLISGIPPWLQMYFERIIQRKPGQKIGDIFPNFSLMVTGGVNYEPYRNTIDKLIGRKIDIVQTYPASEGFIAYQDKTPDQGLLLYLDGGIFYEFIPVAEFHQENPTRISLKDVELNTDYVLILNTNAGLWGYNIGDTVQFVSKKPYRIIVSGRIKHYISAFGEHVIGHEVETAMQKTLEKYPAQINEFTVAPQVNPQQGLPYHQWFIEFTEKPKDIDAFALELDRQMCLKNSYYKDLIKGNVLCKLKIFTVPKAGFQNYMKSIGKLGGQNKIPRLSNDRKIADKLMAL